MFEVGQIVKQKYYGFTGKVIEVLGREVCIEVTDDPKAKATKGKWETMQEYFDRYDVLGFEHPDSSLQVGDTVRILPRKDGQLYQHPNYIESMLQYVGGLDEISSFTKSGYVRLMGTPFYTWHTDWLEKVCTRPSVTEQKIHDASPSLYYSGFSEGITSLGTSGLPYSYKEILKSSSSSKKKGIMAKISTFAKIILDKDIKKLVKAGYLDRELSITQSGMNALASVLFSGKWKTGADLRTELVGLAEDTIKEEKEDRCCD